MDHYYRDLVISKNNFLKDPFEAIEITKSLDFNFKDKSFPGSRTDNIADSKNHLVRNFADKFINQLVSEIYPKIKSMTIDVRFHNSQHYSENHQCIKNQGWIHTDHELLAGLVYLNPYLHDIESGTSIYKENAKYITEPNIIREQFNCDPYKIDESFYKQQLINHNSQYNESIRFANTFNRLISYDSKLPHKPNNYYIGSNQVRLTLLFVISEYEVYSR